MRIYQRPLLAILLLCLSAACKTTARAPVYLIKVEKGDTLASIAMKYDTTWEKIAKLNDLIQGQSPKVGTVLRVSPGPGGLVADDQGGFLYSGVRSKKPSNVAGRLPQNTKARQNIAESEDDFPDLPRAGGQGSGRGGFFFGGAARESGLEWPLYGELSSLYGSRHGRFHHGIDIRAKKGTTVLAAGIGTVEFAGRQNGYGKVVIIKHKGVKTVYAHLSSIDVDVGQSVNRSTVVGETGLSGNSTGPHLHFEIRTLQDQSVDPLSVLEKDKLIANVQRSGHAAE